MVFETWTATWTYELLSLQLKKRWLSRFVRSTTNVKDSFILIISHFNKQIDIIYEIKKRNGIMGLFFFGIEGHFWFTESGN